jgi:carbon-monoxide dehydrogenase medium subunit
MEAALSEQFSATAIETVAIDEEMLLSDIHAGADYRAHLVREMTRRAITACQP